MTAEDGSTQNYTVTVVVAQNTAKAITAFRFASLAVGGLINTITHALAVTVPFGTDIISLTPTIVHAGASISPASGDLTDFTLPVVYRVTAADGSTQNFTVTVVIAPSNAKAITSFSFASFPADGIITESTHVIDVTVPYPTVEIATQCWMAKNLNVGTMVIGSDGQDGSSDFIEKYCYDDDPANCATYGGLYTWNEAMGGETDETSRGICPDGWHIPSDTEYVELIDNLGDGSCSEYPGGNYPAETVCGSPAGDLLKTPGLCQGRTPCGDTGFNGLLNGWSTGSGAAISYIHLGTMGGLWTSSSIINEAWRRSLALDQSGVDGSYFWTQKSDARAVRCVKDNVVY